MQPVQILRFDRSDEQGASVLLNVSSSGTKPLDLKLVATEKEHIYHAALRQSKIDSLRAKTYGGPNDEWRVVLEYVLLRKLPQESLGDALQGIETIASISGSNISITIRKNIGGVTQRLGLIKLEQDDEREEISFPDWVDAAVKTIDEFQQKVERAEAATQIQEERVAQLQAQLDELINAKKEHDDELLQKFAALLNAKKLKIRDQQRLLASANVDPKAVPQSLRDDQDPALAIRKIKRPRVAEPPAVQTEDVDGGTDSEDEVNERDQETPEPTDDDDDDSHHGHASVNMDVDDGNESWRIDTNRTSSAVDTNTSKRPPSPHETSKTATKHQPRTKKSQISEEDDDDETDDEL